MTGKTSLRVGEARDTVTSHYVFEVPVRLQYWLTVGCMLALVVTGHFIGRPLPSVSGEVTYLFYMGDIRPMHFVAAIVLTVILLIRIYRAFASNCRSRELLIMPVWRHNWQQDVYSVARWYLFLEKRPGDDTGRDPIAQAAICGYFLLSVFTILTGFALYSEHSRYAVFALFRCATEFFCWAGGNSLDIHSWYRLETWSIAAFIIGHVYVVICEDIASDEAVISTIINGFCSHKSPKGQRGKEAS